MRITVRRHSYESGPNLTSLVDVVMVVLIFLMLAGSFATKTHLLTDAMQAIGPAKGSVIAPPATLDIRISEDSATGTFVATAGEIRVAGNGLELAERLRAKRLAYTAAGADIKDIQVVLRPSNDLPYGHLIAVREAAERAGFVKIGLAATR